MKKHIKLYSSIFLFLVLSTPVFTRAADRSLTHPAYGDDIKKKRTINKSYHVTSEDKLEIENQFGNVKVDTWDKSEIAVDIEIGVKRRRLVTLGINSGEAVSEDVGR